MVVRQPIPPKARPQFCAQGANCIHGSGYCGQVVVHMSCHFPFVKLQAMQSDTKKEDCIFQERRLHPLLPVPQDQHVRTFLCGGYVSCCSFSFTILLVAPAMPEQQLVCMLGKRHSLAFCLEHAIVSTSISPQDALL